MSSHRLHNFLVCLLLTFPNFADVHVSARPGDATSAQTDHRALEPNKPVERVIAEGETHHYSLRLSAGDFLQVFVRQRGVNVVTALLGPGGKTLLEADSPVTTEEADWITHAATETGEYAIEVRGAGKGAPPGRYEITIEERRKATAGDDVRLSAERAFIDGSRLFVEKNYPGAVEKYQDALAMYRRSRRRVEEAVTLNCIARSYVVVNAYAAALERYNDALSIYKATGDVQAQGYTEQQIGDAYFSSNRYDDARSHYEQALDLRRKVGYRAGEAMSLRALGAAVSSMSQQEKAIDYFQQAVTISRAERFRSEEARALSNLGIAYNMLAQPEKAIEYSEAALAISREIKDRNIEANTLGNLGGIYRALSRYDESIQYNEQLLAISRELKDRTGEGRALNNIGSTYVQLARYEKALEFLEPALAIAREVKNRINEAFALSNLGYAYFWLSAYDKSIDYSEQSLAIFREIKNRGEEGRILNNLGDAYNAQGQYEKSVSYYEQALAIARAVKNPAREARALGSLGMAYSALGRYDRAIESHEQGLILFRQAQDRADEAATLVSLGEAYHAQKRYEKAIDYYQQALPLTRAVKNRTGEALNLGDLMLAWKDQGDDGVAILYGKQAVNVFQDVRRNLKTLDSAFQDSYLNSHEETYRTLADLLISQGRLSEAEKVLELLKEEEFNRVIRRNGPSDPRIGLTTTEAEAAKIDDQLASLATERGPLLAKIASNTATGQDRQRLDQIEIAITEANKRIKLVLAEVVKGAPDERTMTQQSQSMMQSLRRLGKGTVALYTVVTSDSGWVILTTPDFRRAYPIKRADLNRTISDFRSTLASDRQDPIPLARSLYEALFLQKNEEGTTLAGDLKAYHARTLMWSLDGVLRYVPMGALHDGKEYLVERYSNVVFTTASLTRLLDPAPGSWRAFGLGVSKEYRGFSALPSVPRELHSIIRDGASAEPQGVLPGVIRLDEQFTRKAMMDGLHEGYPVVHIASHFSFNPAKEETSFLLLGDGSTLSLEEMQNSPGIFERVELLTLSACDTATTNANGKEVEGMAFVAQDLGAKAVVASLWPVADVGTEVLMREFYRLRQANPRWSKAEALRQAQMALLEGKHANAKFAHPHYWAPFILVGNWK